MQQQSDELYLLLVQHRNRNNRLVDQLKKQGVIDETTCNNLKSNGAHPGILYDKPKFHKKGIHMRPTRSTIGTFNYNVSRWLVPMDLLVHHFLKSWMYAPRSTYLFNN